MANQYLLAEKNGCFCLLHLYFQINILAAMALIMNKVRSAKKNSENSKWRSTGTAAAQITRVPVAQNKLFAFLLLVIAVLPLFVHSQWITGPIVNAVLIFTCLKIGFRAALFLACVPSVAALTSGLLPFDLAPIIPFIVTANIILISVFNLLPNVNFFITLTLAAFFKYLFLYSSVHFLAHYFLPNMYIANLLVMMGGLQFSTAMMGGLIAYSLLKGLAADERNYYR